MVNDKNSSTEARILAAARKVFIEHGMAGARMQDIADEAGINKALLHYYFRNKEQLFDKIFRELMADFWPQLSALLDSDAPLFDKIESFCEVYIDRLSANPYLPLFVLGEMNRRPRQFFKKMFGANPPDLRKLLAQINEQVKAGMIRPVSPMQLVIHMISLIIFPFIGKPMFMSVMNINGADFDRLIRERKKEIPRLIIDSIKN